MDRYTHGHVWTAIRGNTGTCVTCTDTCALREAQLLPDQASDLWLIKPRAWLFKSLTCKEQTHPWHLPSLINLLVLPLRLPQAALGLVMRHHRKSCPGHLGGCVSHQGASAFGAPGALQPSLTCCCPQYSWQHSETRTVVSLLPVQKGMPA